MMVRKFLVLVICCLLCVPVGAAENEKLVALTFDDGPSGRFTRRLLDGLAERNAKATFLLCGYRMEQYPELTQRIWREGHEIGVHGYSHTSMKDMCSQETAREIRKTVALLPDGCKATFLRPPGGLCSGCIQSESGEFGMSILHWSLDPKDWNTRDANAVYRSVVSRVRDGDVILLHDMSDSSVDAALAMVDTLQKQGFTFVTASELAHRRNTALLPGRKYTRFPPPDPEAPSTLK